MPSGKARYKGDGARTPVRDFSPELKKTLRKYYPGPQAADDPVWGHPAENFVNHVLEEARWALASLHWQSFEITKQEIRAEHNDLLRLLKRARYKLRHLSPDFDRLLGIDADPLQCAEQAERMIAHLEAALPQIDSLGPAKKPAHKKHAIALEMSIRVLRALRDYGIPPKAGGKAETILTAIGNDIGIVLASTTWRDTIAAAKSRASDLRQ